MHEDPTTFGVDPRSLARWMLALGIDVSEPLQIDRIGIGQSNLTFRVGDADGRRWVLRRPPLATLLASAHDVAREARILSALADTAVPVPRVYGLTSFGDAPAVLMEFVDGLVVDRVPVAEAMSLQHRHAIGVELARTLATIHAVDLDSTGLTGLASHESYARRQLRRWSAQWQQSRTRELPALDSLTERLLAAVPEQRTVTLVHGDFHLRNVITSSVGRVAAVLDWELCTLGDPAADLGTLLAYWPEACEPTAGELSASTLPGFPGRQELVTMYVELSGQDTSALGFWHAVGLWKTAIIGEGVLRRATDEPRNRAAFGTPTVGEIDAYVMKADEVAAAAGI